MTREEAIDVLSDFRKFTHLRGSDLIRRQDAIDAVDRVDEAHMRLKGRPMLGWCALLDEIESIPSAEPKTGEWIQKDMYADRFCSECDYAVWDSEAEEYNFCPNCGADMRCGESDERREEDDK